MWPNKELMSQKRTVAVAATESSGHIMFTSKQYEQLMKSLPYFSNHAEASNSVETDDELDNEYVTSISWYTCLTISKVVIHGCIIDTRASDHMTPNAKEDLTTKKVLALGKRKHGLYHLLNIPLDQIHSKVQSMMVTAMEDCSLFSIFSTSVNENKHATSVFSNSCTLWHPRLGHFSNSNLKHVPCDSLSKLNANFDVCLSCHMAKFTKLSYSYGKSHAVEPFNLIHIDIWGTYKVHTNGKFKYFLTIVNDCSRATWTYLLVQKSDSFKVLTTFCKSIETQFDRKVKVIRSNNALEFLKRSIGPYLTEQGIEHQTSYVNRPQQDGIIERKHKHILEVARALRFHAHLPLEYWGDCVLTSTFLIDRTPSSVLQHKTPYEVLLNKKPDYQFLKVFGCLAMASNPDRAADKFYPRGVPYLDVQFHEDIFLYSQPHMMKLLNPLPSPSSQNTLELNGTWEITDLPPSKKPIDSHWIYKTKLKADGIEDKKKAILVINGNRQRNGVDYKETFAPMDVSNAFLHGDLFEDVYMRIPIGYSGVGGTVQDISRSNKSNADYSLFTKKDNTSFTVVLVYVDDLMITGTHYSEIQNLKSQLSYHFYMKALSSLNYWVGSV
ncbi:retrovirus-related pol polyprotein from transposon TNT 1-94 [Tanacetum coccineum]